MPNDVIDVHDLPAPFVEAIRAAVSAFRNGTQRTSVTASEEPRRVGWAADVLPPLPDSFFDPLPDDVLNSFEGNDA